MAEPSLTWALTTPADYTDYANGAIETFVYRTGYYAEARKTEYDAWVAWAATSGSADQQAIEAKYSAYAFTIWYDTNGMPGITAIIEANTGGLASWYPCQSGVCLEDVTYNFGGYCFFYQHDGCDQAT